MESRSGRRRPALLFGAAALASAAQGAYGVFAGLDPSAGLLAVGLPWAGLAFYAVAAALAARRPDSAWVPRAAASAAAVHATLLMELLIDRRFCAGCVGVAVFGGAAAAAVALGRRETGGSVAAAVALGAVVGSLSPVDAVDGVATRWLWPSRILARAPEFVDRAALAGCEHGSGVRVLIYEKDCKG